MRMPNLIAPVRNVRANRFGWYPPACMICSIFCFVSSDTLPLLWRTRSTVAIETCASRAISVMVIAYIYNTLVSSCPESMTLGRKIRLSHYPIYMKETRLMHLSLLTFARPSDVSFQISHCGFAIQVQQLLKQK